MVKNYFIKIAILYFILLYSAIPANSQNIVIDSLSVLLKESVEPIEQVDLLNEIVLQKIRGNIVIDSLSIEKNISLAKKYSYEEGLATALKNSGIWSIINSNYDKAEGDLIAAKDIYNRLGSDKMVAKLNNNLSILYLDIGEYDKALENLKNYLEYAVTSNDSISMAKAYNNFANVYVQIGENQKAINSYIKSLTLDSLLNNARGQVITSINLAEQYRIKGEFSKSVPISLHALEKAQELHLDISIFWALTTIGLTYKDIENHEKSLHYLSLASKKAVEMDINNLVGASYTNLSQVYEVINIDSAIIYLEKTKNISQMRPEYLAKVLINLGAILNEKKNDYNGANTYLIQAKEIGEETNNQGIIGLANSNLGHLYFSTNEYDRSIYHYETAIQASKETADLKLLKDIYRSIANPYYAKEQWEKGKESLNNFAIILDSLLTEERATTKILMSYEVERQKQLDEIQIQEKTRELQQRNHTLFGLFIGAIFLMVFAYQRNKIAKSEMEKSKNTEAMSAELHHRIRNNLATFSSLISIKGNTVKDENAIEVLTSIQDRVIALEKIHTRLYKGNNALEVEVIDFLTYLTNEIILMNIYEENAIDTQVEFNGNKHQITSINAIEMGKVVNEIITNAFKYSIEKNHNPRIRVVGNIDNSVLLLTIANNGAFLPENFNIDDLNSFGLKWVKGICRSNKWQYSYQNKNNEVIFEFKIPLK